MSVNNTFTTNQEIKASELLIKDLEKLTSELDIYINEIKNNLNVAEELKAKIDELSNIINKIKLNSINK